MISVRRSRMETGGLIDQTVAIVSAYVAHNHVAANQLPSLVATIHGALCRLDAVPGAGATHGSVDGQPSAVQIRRSITDEALTSFIDGRTYRTLKRHLTAHGLTPERYRAHYGLPNDYPMVAASYAARRSALAKAIGLGVPGAQAARQAAE